MKDCGESYTVDNTEKTVSGSLVGATVQYSCSPGYEYVSGTTVSLCETTGRWSEPTITCRGGFIK